MQVSATAILLKQLISMLQLQLTQPHILTTIITSKWCQVLYSPLRTLCPLIAATSYSASPSILIGGTSAWTPLSYQSRSSETWNTLCTPRKAAREDRSSLYAVSPICYITTNGPTNLSLNFRVPCSRRLRIDNKTLVPTSNSACHRLASAYFFWYYWT